MNGTWDAAVSRVPSVFSFITKNMNDNEEQGSRHVDVSSSWYIFFNAFFKSFLFLILLNNNLGLDYLYGNHNNQDNELLEMHHNSSQA